ncbi:MAG: class I SAM-dependent methyltransferase [Methylomonas sp.]|nr:class I SAM-dependent methyltransferase [Methylomonas sp.]
MTKRFSLSNAAHDIIREYLREGMAAIDATLGNGHDTAFLAQCVGLSGHVYGFDIQAQAVQATQARLQRQGLEGQTRLFQASHAEMPDLIPQVQHGRIQAVMFNLGYLPGGDKAVITRSESTLRALNAACGLLAVHGVMTVMAYPGHAGGDDETDAVERWAQVLDSAQFQHRIILSQHHRTGAPRLFVIRKLR